LHTVVTLPALRKYHAAELSIAVAFSLQFERQMNSGNEIRHKDEFFCLDLIGRHSEF
jgi:hypothetical protein